MSSDRDRGLCGREDLSTHENGDNSTELHFVADGRVYLFGATTEVLEAILASGVEDESLLRRMMIVHPRDTTNDAADVGSAGQSRHGLHCGTDIIDAERVGAGCKFGHMEVTHETKHWSIRQRSHD